MRAPKFVRWLTGKLPESKTRIGREQYRPRLEALEDRTVPTTFTVTNIFDNVPGSLRAAIDLANKAPGPDTINFSDQVKGTITLFFGQLLITDSVTVSGPGANKLSISGNDASRVFETAVASQNVTISGLTITHGYAADQGGGIKNAGANLTLSGVNLTQNVAYESSTTVPADVLAVTAPTGNPVAGPAGLGGGLVSLGGTLTITGCRITGNKAVGGAGASRFGEAIGGGIAILGGNRATIKSSTLSGNLARGGDNSKDGRTGGGGLITWAPISIMDCTFSGNVADGPDDTPNNFATGGALNIQPSATGNIISGSTFNSNQAVAGNGGTGAVGNAGGGAIFNLGTLSIFGSTFDHNQARAGSGGNCGLDIPGANVGWAQGGAIANVIGFEPAVIDIANSTFRYNQAVGGNNSTITGIDLPFSGGAEGGALFNVVASTMNVSYCTLDHNEAIGGNGNTSSSPVLMVGTGLGGAISSNAGGPALGGPNTLTVSHCTLSQNRATGGDNNHGAVTGTGLVGAGVGAGIANYLGGTATISDSELDHNQASRGRHNTADGGGTVVPGLGAGAAIFNWLGVYTSTLPFFAGPFGDSVVNVSNCLIDHNQAQGGDGGSAQGGGIANMSSAKTTVEDSVLIQNQTSGGKGAGLGGGASNDATSTLTLSGCIVTLNKAKGKPGKGGGVFNLGSFSHPGSLILFNDASTSGDDIGN